MFGPIVTWAAGIVGPKLAQPILWAGTALLLAATLAVGKCSYDRAVIARHDAEVAERARPADANAAAAREADHRQIDQDTQEVKNALDPLPDAGLTARQRARACAILMRQTGDAHPPGC